jgi:hypothetical protein
MLGPPGSHWNASYWKSICGGLYHEAAILNSMAVFLQRQGECQEHLPLGLTRHTEETRRRVGLRCF